MWFRLGFPTVEPVLLELPPYSIYEYNRHKGREDTKYRDDDKILHEHIRIVNTFVRETNKHQNREYMYIQILLKQSNMTQCWVFCSSMHSPGKLSDKFSTTKVSLIQKLSVYHHIEIKLHRYPDIVLYLWLGTCDLTVKQHDGLIELKSRDKSSAIDLIKTTGVLRSLIFRSETLELYSSWLLSLLRLITGYNYINNKMVTLKFVESHVAF
jgi:hypothetical protein